MRPNRLRDLKAAGTPIVNAWAALPSGYAAEIIAHAGHDAVTIDCQHGMMGFDTAFAMLQAVSTSDAVPLVRPSGLVPAEIMRWLDAGSYGIICPMISSVDEARALVAACRYPPAGQRSFGPARGLLYGGSDYFDHANNEVLVLAMIETREGLADAEAIAAVPGLDGIYIGPNDLSLALGEPPLSGSATPVVRAAIERIRAACAANGGIAGIFCADGAAAATRIAEGFDLVTPGNDANWLKAAAAAAARAARGAA
jgi:4-hydroxy-2-oxoheptanedioate aldolase